MRYLALAIFGLVFSCNSFGQQQEFSWTGIWQDINHPSRYFTIHEDGDDVVLIVLVHVDAYGDALKAAYMGKKGAPFLDKLDPSPNDIFNKVVLQIRSPTEGVVYPYTQANPVVTRLRRVF
jgi:hypothetical protein